MGIKGLAKLLSDEAPDSMREVDLKSLHGRKIAIDASMAIYQFLIAIRSASHAHHSSSSSGDVQMQLTNSETGRVTSHVQGLLYRTLRYLSEGVRVTYVFDGAPPQLKQSHELQVRKEKRKLAQSKLEQAQAQGNVAEQDKQQKRLVRASAQENDDCRTLLTLMGVPVVQAPCEAEAQAAAMAKEGLVYAAATEDMDALTFGTPLLLRKMTFAAGSGSSGGSSGGGAVQVVQLDKALSGLELSHAQFVDLCILLGCDYCDTIKGIGPKTALKLLREHQSIEEILKVIDRTKYRVPPSWLPPLARNKGNKNDPTTDNNSNHSESEDEEKDKDEDDEHENDHDQEQATKDDHINNNDKEEAFVPAYQQARELFLHHETTTDSNSTHPVDLQWKPCQPDALTNFLVNEMGFNPDRVKACIDKLQAAYQKHRKPQARLDAFFKPKISTNTSADTKKRPSSSSKTITASSLKKTNTAATNTATAAKKKLRRK